MLEPQDYELELPEIASPIHKLQQPNQVSLAHCFLPPLNYPMCTLVPKYLNPLAFFSRSGVPPTFLQHLSHPHNI